MTAIRITIDFKARTARFNESAIEKWILRTLKRTRTHVRGKLNSGGRSGVKYPNLPNRSSAPGEYPRTQSDKLARQMTMPTASGRQGEFGETAFHARFLEFGSPKGKIKPRPHLRPSLKWGVENTPLPADIVEWS